MSSLAHLPHVSEIPNMTREELISAYEPIEQEVRDIREEMRSAYHTRDLGLPVDAEWISRLRYGKQLRERLLTKLKLKLIELKRYELGGDPAAITHRAFLHSVFAAVGELEQSQKEALLTRARVLQARYQPNCEQCAMRQARGSRDGERPQGVSEHVDPEHSEPAIVSHLSEAHLVPPTFPGNEH